MALSASGNEATAPPFRQSAEAVAATLNTDPTCGLGDDEARARLARHGPNELEAEPPVPAWRRFLAQFRDTLVALLLVATAISIGLWSYERDTPLPYEGLVILAIVLINGVLGFEQEARAEQSLAALRAMTVTQASIVRDGERRRIPASELVPGDLIAIEEGDTTPGQLHVSGGGRRGG